jgi:hypothetical protein
MTNVILRVLGVLGLSIVSAILYRLGGSSKEDQQKEFPWIPVWFRKIPKKRDVMSNICKLGAVWLMFGIAPFWAYFIAFGLYGRVLALISIMYLDMTVIGFMDLCVGSPCYL